jgi:hypothetical protein
VDWASAVPAGGAGAVTLERSASANGPWSLVAAGLPDNGRHQAQLGGASGGLGCSYPPVGTLYLRATLQTTGGGASGTAGPFTLHNDCYADCNKDGQLTVADFGCFQTAFVQEGCDCDCNSQCTVADFGCFQTAFVLGCP